MRLDEGLIPVVLFVFVGFLIGGLWFFLSSLGRHREERKKRTWKYWSYACIVSISGLAAALGGFVWLVFSLLIILAGALELIRAIRYKRVYFILPVFGFYILIGVGFLFSYIVLNSRLLVWLYLGIAGFDAFSQIAGQSFGKRKLSPEISPNKTWVGFVGGLLYLIIFSEFLFQFWGFLSWKGFGLSIFLGCLGLAGDLAASWVKRKVGIKDYSSILPGHGGILDRYDSFIFATAIWTLSSLCWAGLSNPWL